MSIDQWKWLAAGAVGALLSGCPSTGPDQPPFQPSGGDLMLSGGGTECASGCGGAVPTGGALGTGGVDAAIAEAGLPDGGGLDSAMPSAGPVLPPDPVASEPEALGVLLGPDADFPQQGLTFFGTDLGFPVLFEDTFYLLFGDTIEQPTAVCSAQGNDDSMGTLPRYFDGSQPKLEMIRQMPGSDRFSRIQLWRDGRPLDTTLGRVPIGAFDNGGQLVSLFNRLIFEPCVNEGGTSTCPIGHQFACTSRAGRCEPNRSVVVPPLCDFETKTGCQAGQTCVEAYPGYCVDLSSSQNDDTVNGEIASVVQSLEWGVARSGDLTQFDHSGSFATSKFINPAVETVSRWTGAQRGNDFAPGQGAVLIWGRPGFVAEGSRQAQLYLMVQPLPIPRDGNGQLEFEPDFFAGLDTETGQPRWSSVQRDAQAIALDGVVGGSPNEALSIVNQMSVSWVGEPVSKWVMLYGGDISDLLVPNAPALRNGPAPGSIVVRYADYPWGPFSDPKPHLLPGAAAAVGQPYGPGGYLYHPECVNRLDGTCAAPNANYATGLSCVEAIVLWDQARMYGATIMSPYTAPNSEGGADIVWNMSAWNPYHIVTFKTSLQPQP